MTTTTAPAPIVPTMTDDTLKAFGTDAANARAEARIGATLAPVWDAILTANPDVKRAAVVRAVLEASGLWRDTPQKDESGTRTPFGNVVQRFGARYDAAVKRAKGEADADAAPVLRATLSGEGGGSVTIPADHALYAGLVALIGAAKA
jgi:hypothetical protein